MMSNIQSARQNLAAELDSLRARAEKVINAIAALDALEGQEKPKAQPKPKQAKTVTKKAEPKKPEPKKAAKKEDFTIPADGWLAALADGPLTATEVAMKVAQLRGIKKPAHIKLLKQRAHPMLANFVKKEKLVKSEDGKYSIV